MEKLCVCGNLGCDSPFHAGDDVEVKWGNQWILGKVTAEARTRVTVSFLRPVLYTQKTVIVTIVKNFWGREKISTTEEWEDKVLEELTFGASYVSFPGGKGWERP